ncbi:MAG: alanine dehydrogenase [Candidatus Aminicenantes bacterium]|nr:alanine dehydrogenase [Candidatus Aminicenantes bacterium]
MEIGIPREIYIDEKRVPLIPAGVHALTSHGNKVYVESKAGTECGYTDENYRQAGAQIVFSHEEPFRRAELVAKINPPTLEESAHLREGLIHFSALQLGIGTREMLQKIRDLKVAAFGYELMQDKAGSFPVLVSMGEIAGGMLPQIAGRFLECGVGGRGICLSGAPGIPPANVVIIGAGVVGSAAARAFMGLGAQVMVMDTDKGKLRRLTDFYGNRLVTSMATSYNIEKFVKFADVLIGCVFAPGEKTPHVVTRSMVKKMKNKSLIIDVSIDVGGCVETSHPTTHSNPVYVEEGVIHYCVPNIPAAVSRSSSYALSNVLLPFIEKVATHGLEEAIKSYPYISNGLYSYDGRCVNQRVAQAFGWQYHSLAEIAGLKE